MSTSDLSAVPRQQVGLATAAALKEAVFIEYDYHLISHFPPSAVAVLNRRGRSPEIRRKVGIRYRQISIANQPQRP